MVGCVGVVGVLEFRFSTCSLAGWGVGLLGCSGEGSGGLWGCVLGLGMSFLGLHIIYMRLVTASRLVLAGNGGWSTCYLTS